MLALDSLVFDLIFTAGANPSPESLVEALGGEDVLDSLKVLVPDMEDPRFEMELSPSRPFRRRGEHRVMLIDDSVAPMREDPRGTPVIAIDLRPARDRLIAVCEALGDIRLGRIFALGSWGDAVLVAKTATDMRAMALLPWVLDPGVDLQGRRVAGQLQPAQFEEKIKAYEKRLLELDEETILDRVDATITRRDQFLVVDVLEEDGTWDLRKSHELEMALAAVDLFSLIPGAPQSGKSAAHEPAAPDSAPPSPQNAAAVEPERPSLPPLTSTVIDGKVVVIFPAARFDLEVAAALGKSDWSSVLRAGDSIDGRTRDSISGRGAGFLAPLEFLSEVFVDGKPLSRPEFEAHARTIDAGARVIDVHCPRFGPALLIDLNGIGRFISSERDLAEGLVKLLRSRA